MAERPKVGLAVVLRRGGKILLGQRIGAHGSGSWSFPGGHLEMNESWEDCAAREALEETGLKIRNVEFWTATNDVFTDERKHYVTVFVWADCPDGEPKVMEPEKCLEWRWFDPEELPAPLFLPIRNLLKDHRFS